MTDAQRRVLAPVVMKMYGAMEHDLSDTYITNVGRELENKMKAVGAKDEEVNALVDECVAKDGKLEIPTEAKCPNCGSTEELRDISPGYNGYATCPGCGMC